MSNRYYSAFPERKVTNEGAKKSRGGSGSPAKPGPLHDTPVGYQPAGKTKGVGFNRAAKFPVVKTRVAKAGLD